MNLVTANENQQSLEEEKILYQEAELLSSLIPVITFWSIFGQDTDIHTSI